MVELYHKTRQMIGTIEPRRVIEGIVVAKAKPSMDHDDDDGDENGREVEYPKRGSDGLIIQPKELGSKREVVEQHNRHRFSEHFKYADPYEGNSRTFDPEGNYNCGRCNMETKSMCLLIKKDKGSGLFPIDEKAGSCGDWEDKFSGDPELALNEKSVDAAQYGVAKNGVGFGCHRCPYASKAYEPDSQGRSLYCGKGDFRVYPNACCALNGAPTL